MQVEHSERSIEVKTTANCNSLCQIYTSKYTNLLINFATNTELNFSVDVAFREVRRDGEPDEKNFWFATALLFAVVVVTRRAVQNLLQIPLTDKALSL